MINLSKTPVDLTLNPSEPTPVAIQGDGQKCWEIKSIKDDVIYKIWAHSYQRALDLLPKIESL
jgi:hypothetical protein